MAAASETIQAIGTLTPLAEVLALIDREVKPAAPKTMVVAEGLHRVLAADVVTPMLPARATALIDGWAVAAETTLDASGYVPASLPQMPVRVAPGEAMPSGADAVAPFDAVKVTGSRAAALAVINPGDGVLPAGEDCDGKMPLRHAGELLRALDIPVLAAAKISHVSTRSPRLRVIAPDDSLLNAVAHLLATDAGRSGGEIITADGDMRSALADASADLIVVIGGASGGTRGDGVQTLAAAGRLAVHGIGLTPGETTAVAFAGGRPVLLLPARLDAALAAWLALGRHIVKRLTAGTTEEPAATLTLSRKIASGVGFAEVIPVRRAGDAAEPLAAKYLSLSALAHSDGWILVPAESEGYSAGTPVSVRPWP